MFERAFVVSSCLSLSCFSPTSTSCLFHCLFVLCPAHHLQCRDLRGLKPLHSRTMRSVASWRYTILSQFLTFTSLFILFDRFHSLLISLSSFFSSYSLDFGMACENISWNRCTSTPHRSETNGIAERAIRRVKEGTSAILLQSRLRRKMLG